jgi:hypothetical protein
MPSSPFTGEPQPLGIGPYHHDREWPTADSCCSCARQLSRLASPIQPSLVVRSCAFVYRKLCLALQDRKAPSERRSRRTSASPISQRVDRTIRITIQCERMQCLFRTAVLCTSVLRRLCINRRLFRPSLAKVVLAESRSAQQSNYRYPRKPHVRWAPHRNHRGRHSLACVRTCGHSRVLTVAVPRRSSHC